MGREGAAFQTWKRKMVLTMQLPPGSLLRGSLQGRSAEWQIGRLPGAPARPFTVGPGPVPCSPFPHREEWGSQQHLLRKERKRGGVLAPGPRALTQKPRCVASTFNKTSDRLRG